MNFHSLGLIPELVKSVADAGYTVPTPVQAQAIPIVLTGKDLLVGAQTGTGKTAGFTLPMLQLLNSGAAVRSRPGGPRPIRALVLTPTRELAAQVGESIRTYGKGLPLRSTVVFGGVGIQPQVQALRAGVDILIATPGRLLDHASQRTVNLSNVEILVLDEADRMLDMGFIHDIRKVLALLPKKRQNLLFSATFSTEIRQLADRLLDHPAMVDVPREDAVADLIRQIMHPVAKGRKRELLSKLIGGGDWQQVLVFTRTKHGANRLSQQLERDGISAAAIHGNKSQSARTKALADFKRGTIRALVATDIAARGLDINQLPHVVNFELPNVPEDYVHRIGRTGRAGNNGIAVSLVCEEEIKLLRAIERLTRFPVPKVVISGFQSETPDSRQESISEERPPFQGRGQSRRPAQGARREYGTDERSSQPSRGPSRRPAQGSRQEPQTEDRHSSNRSQGRRPAPHGLDTMISHSFSSSETPNKDKAPASTPSKPKPPRSQPGPKHNNQPPGRPAPRQSGGSPMKAPGKRSR